MTKSTTVARYGNGEMPEFALKELFDLRGSFQANRSDDSLDLIFKRQRLLSGLEAL